jgi:hypothetical protein
MPRSIVDNPTFPGLRQAVQGGLDRAADRAARVREAGQRRDEDLDFLRKSPVVGLFSEAGGILARNYTAYLCLMHSSYVGGGIALALVWDVRYGSSYYNSFNDLRRHSTDWKESSCSLERDDSGEIISYLFRGGNSRNIAHVPVNAETQELSRAIEPILTTPLDGSWGSTPTHPVIPGVIEVIAKFPPARQR